HETGSAADLEHVLARPEPRDERALELVDELVIAARVVVAALAFVPSREGVVVRAVRFLASRGVPAALGTLTMKPGNHPDFFRLPPPPGRSRESRIVLDAEGRFSNAGIPIDHEGMAVAFASWIRR